MTRTLPIVSLEATNVYTYESVKPTSPFITVSDGDGDGDIQALTGRKVLAGHIDSPPYIASGTALNSRQNKDVSGCCPFGNH